MVESRKERIVEVYIGYGDSQGGTWEVEEVVVDARLDPEGQEEQIREDALNLIRERLNGQLRDLVAFMGVYSIFDDDTMEGYWEDLDPPECPSCYAKCEEDGALEEMAVCSACYRQIMAGERCGKCWETSHDTEHHGMMTVCLRCSGERYPSELQHGICRDLCDGEW